MFTFRVRSGLLNYIVHFHEKPSFTVRERWKTMNNEVTRGWGGKVLGDALQAFARTTGLKAKLLTRPPIAYKEARPDAEIFVEHAGKRHHYLVEVRPADRIVALNQTNQQLLKYRKQGILVTPYLAPELANHCQKIGLQFLDTAGNAYLRGPGLFVHIRGERPPRDTTAPRGAGTATALRVIFALLCKPVLLNAPYRDIVAAAHVALGTIGWVLFDLERRGHVVGGGRRKGNRRFVDANRLIDEWTINYPLKLRPKLILQRLRATNNAWWRTADLKKHGAVWGGEVAADQLTGNREPGAFTVYLPDNPGKFVIDNRLRADADGDIELLRKFWYFEPETTNTPNLAPPLLVYADLMATPDPRNHDTAKQVYDEFLAHAFDKA